MLYLRALSEGERILDVDAQIANGALDLRVAKHGAKIACLLVDDGGLGSAQRMRPVVLRPQPDSGHPLIEESSILPGADMISVIDSARKDELVKRATSAFQPGKQASSCVRQQLELDRPTGLLLHDDGTGADLPAYDQVAN